MPIIRANPLLLHFAHVPKCGGSAIEAYLSARFGQVAMLDAHHHFHAAEERWSRTSPQHMSLDVHRRLFPAGFFDRSFAVVRHPAHRLVSVYHFQREIEKHPTAQAGFSEWLDVLPDMLAKDPFAFDNHARPMVQLVPEDAQIFHLEHGLDGLVLWLDELTGNKDGPRAIRPTNERKSRGGPPKVKPSDADLQRIGEIYAEDFARFGYDLDRKGPNAPAPELSPEFIAERDVELARKPGVSAWVKHRIARARRPRVSRAKHPKT